MYGLRWRYGLRLRLRQQLLYESTGLLSQVRKLASGRMRAASQQLPSAPISPLEYDLEIKGFAFLSHFLIY